MSLLMNALRSVQQSRHRPGAMLALNRGLEDTDDNGNNDDGPLQAGGFNGNQPLAGDLPIRGQGSRSSVPATYGTSKILPNPRVEVEGDTSVARSTEQVCRLSFFRITTDPSNLRWGSGS
jgi:hypothetical protein